MIKSDKPVIVEGKYDKITLENVIDALIIPTDGFRIFKNKEKRDMIRKLAQKNGLIVMTDSDYAGAQIRAYIKKIAGNCEIINVCVPCLKGKEKRKTAPSKEGFLGVEGMSADVIIEALKKSGAVTEKDENAENSGENKRKITKTDLFCLGLSGGTDSREKRRAFLKKAGLPENLSPNAMLDLLNNIYTPEEFFKMFETGQNPAQG